MKKLLSALCGVMLCLVISSCSSSPADKVLGMVDDSINKIENATSSIEISQISMQLMADVAKVAQEHPDYEGTPEEQKKIEDKMQEFQKVAMEKIQQLGDIDLGGAADVEEVTEEVEAETL